MYNCQEGWLSAEKSCWYKVEKAQEKGDVAAGRRAGWEYKSPFGTQMNPSPDPDVGHGAKGLGVYHEGF